MQFIQFRQFMQLMQFMQFMKFMQFIGIYMNSYNCGGGSINYMYFHIIVIYQIILLEFFVKPYCVYNFLIHIFWYKTFKLFA